MKTVTRFIKKVGDSEDYGEKWISVNKYKEVPQKCPSLPKMRFVRFEHFFLNEVGSVSKRYEPILYNSDILIHSLACYKF